MPFKRIQQSRSKKHEKSIEESRVPFLTLTTSGVDYFIDEAMINLWIIFHFISLFAKTMLSNRSMLSSTTCQFNRKYWKDCWDSSYTSNPQKNRSMFFDLRWCKPKAEMTNWHNWDTQLQYAGNIERIKDVNRKKMEDQKNRRNIQRKKVASED